MASWPELEAGREPPIEECAAIVAPLPAMTSGKTTKPRLGAVRTQRVPTDRTSTQAADGLPMNLPFSNRSVTVRTNTASLTGDSVPQTDYCAHPTRTLLINICTVRRVPHASQDR